MTSFKKLTLAFALTLAGTACGDDSNNPGGESKPDAGDVGDDAGGAGGDAGSGIVANRACKGGYEGFTNTQITEGVKNEMGACANEPDIEGVCARDESADPVSVAKDVGLGCYFAYNGDETLTEEQRGEKIFECTLVGTRDNPGLTLQLKTMSKACLSCYADSVLCATKFCATQCSADASSPECSKCRDDNNCVTGFYDCTGLASGDELKAAK